MQLSNPASHIQDGRKVVASAGTAEQLSSAATRCRSLVITAEEDNTGMVVVGGSTVVATAATRRGTPLSAGQSISMDVNNLAVVWLDAEVTGDGVTFSFLVM